MAKNVDSVEEFDVAPAAAEPAPSEPSKAKPYGQNAGDVVDASDAVGGRYEALGAGKMRRLPD